MSTLCLFLVVGKKTTEFRNDSAQTLRTCLRSKSSVERFSVGGCSASAYLPDDNSLEPAATAGATLSNDGNTKILFAQKEANEHLQGGKKKCRKDKGQHSTSSS
jgi:hypothetical protein